MVDASSATPVTKGIHSFRVFKTGVDQTCIDSSRSFQLSRMMLMKLQLNLITSCDFPPNDKLDTTHFRVFRVFHKKKTLQMWDSSSI